MADWRALEVKVDRKMAATFGESVNLSFLSKGTVDPTRPAVEIRAILHTAGEELSTVGQGFRARVAAGEAELAINRSTYPDLVIRAGDRVRANDRAGRPWFEVSAVSDRHSNLLVLSLGEA